MVLSSILSRTGVRNPFIQPPLTTLAAQTECRQCRRSDLHGIMLSDYGSEETKFHSRLCSTVFPELRQMISRCQVVSR